MRSGRRRARAAIADGTIRCWREDGRATEYGVANFTFSASSFLGQVYLE